MPEHAPSTLEPFDERYNLRLADSDTVVTGNNTWEVGMTSEYPRDLTADTDLPAEQTKSTYDEVEAAVDFVAVVQDDHKGNSTKRREFRAEIKDTVDSIDNEGGIDNLAYSAVGAMKMRKAIRKGSLENVDPDEFLHATRSLAAIREMVRVLPKNSQTLFKAKKKEYKNLDLEDEFFSDEADDNLGLGPDDDILLALAEPQKLQEQSNAGGFFSRSREALKSKKVLAALGVVALAGVLHASKGAVSPEHVLPHMQLVGSEHHIGQAAQANQEPVKVAVPIAKPYGYEPSGYKYNDDVSKAEVAAFYASSAGLLAAVALHKHNKRVQAREHHEHAEREHARVAAERVSIKTLVDPSDPAAARLVDAMKHPLLLDEMRDHGAGPSGSRYSSDILIRYARLMASKVGGSATDVTKHFKDLGIDVGSTVFEDVTTRGGGTTINVANSNNQEVASIVEHLTSGPLRLGDLPPTRAFLGDPVIRRELERIHGVQLANGRKIAGLQDLMQLAPSNPYRGQGGPTAHQIGFRISNSVETILYRLARNLPNDDARNRALEAMRLQNLVHTYIPQGLTATGRPRSSRYRRSTPGASGVQASNRFYGLAS